MDFLSKIRTLSKHKFYKEIHKIIITQIKLFTASSEETNKDRNERNHFTINDIFCHGEILHNMQMKKIFPDSKTFVDKKLKYNCSEVIKNYDDFKSLIHRDCTKTELRHFFENNFEDEDAIEEWIPSDWRPNPKFIQQIQNPNLQHFALEVHKLWLTLGRKFKDQFKNNLNRYSLIYLPNPFIIPGGRFREYYYWDTYWIIQGLLLSEMYVTVKGILENYFFLIEQFGFIPNGGRVYYTDRSQPPLLTWMVKEYVEATNDQEFVRKYLHLLEKEFMFWTNNRTVKLLFNNTYYCMFRYDSFSSEPRPESYREDIESTKMLDSQLQSHTYRQIRATTESGIDFSSRWWFPTWSDKSTFLNINTTNIIPVDLNAILYKNALLLSLFFKQVGIENKARLYNDIANQIKIGIDTLLWQEESGIWLDFNFIEQKRQNQFYPTNISPLWSGCFHENRQIGNMVCEYISKNNILSYDGGIPSSLLITGQQWDQPNAWAPQQDMLVTGLCNTGEPNAIALAKTIAKQWILHNYKTFKKDKVMYEKYNSSSRNTSGGGGEYRIQTGFGWTNAVLLKFLNMYRDIMVD